MNKPIISAQNISKKYTLGERQLYYNFRDTISNILKRPFRNENLTQDKFWALKNVSFKINQGDVVGIIGRNGAGKSTLLKILSRITPPTTGEITLRGRVGSLLEVGTGFHQELSGRENVFLNGAILGMSHTEVKAKYNEIVAFAEIEKFIDTPVKHYSTGMYMRLAFAVAAHLEPEILLVDEVLAVGDAQFQKKCLGKMSEVSKKGRTVIFVSHNMLAINQLCNKAILLNKGKMILFGPVKKVVSKYLDNQSLNSDAINYPSNLSQVQITNVTLLTKSDGYGYDYAQELNFEVRLRATDLDQPYFLNVELLNETDETIIFARDIDYYPEFRLKRLNKLTKYRFNIPRFSLVPGKYVLSLSVLDFHTKRSIDMPDKCLSFQIVDPAKILSPRGFPWKGVTSIPINLTYVKQN